MFILLFIEIILIVFVTKINFIVLCLVNIISFIFMIQFLLVSNLDPK